MKKLLMLACLTISLAAFAAPAAAESYVLAIHGATYDAPQGFEMKGYARTTGDNLDGLAISLDLFPSFDTSALFVNNTDFTLKLSVAVKDDQEQNIAHFILDFSSLFNYAAYNNGIFGLLDADNVTFENEIVVDGQSWTVTTVLNKSLEGGAHYTMTSSLAPTAPTPAPAAALLIISGVAGLGVLKRRMK